MSDAQILVCVLWRDWDGLIPSVRKTCSQCKAEIAVDELNIGKVIAEGWTLVCIPCGLAALDTGTVGEVFGGMVAGRMIKSPSEALNAARSRIKRRQG